MLRKLSSLKKRYFVIPIAVVIVIAAAAIMWNIRQKDTLKLSEFREGEIFCYRGIPWNTNVNEVERMLGQQLQQLQSTPVYRAENVTLNGHTAECKMEFINDKRLSAVMFEFQREFEEGTTEYKDYSALEKKMLETFEKKYGESHRQADFFGKDGKDHRFSAWYSETADGQVTGLAVHATYDTEHVLDLSVSASVVPPEVWEKLDN